MLHLTTASELDIAEKSHIHFEGTNLGNVFGPMEMEHPDDLWRLNYTNKVELYGPHRHRVGGPGDADPRTDRRGDDTKEPVFFKSMPFTFYDDLISAYHLKGIVHCSMGDGHAAVAACEHGIPILGICLTEKHCTDLKQHLIDKVYQKMQDPHSNLQQKSLQEELAKSSGKKDDVPPKKPKVKKDDPKKKDGSDDEGKKKTTNKRKSQPKKSGGKGKKRKKVTSSNEDDPSSDSSPDSID